MEACSPLISENDDVESPEISIIEIKRFDESQLLGRDESASQRSLPDAVKEKKTAELLLFDVSNELRILDLRKVPNVTTRKPPEETQRLNCIRLVSSPFQAFHEHEQRVVSRDVICMTILDSVLPETINGSRRFALQHFELRKTS